VGLLEDPDRILASRPTDSFDPLSLHLLVRVEEVGDLRELGQGNVVKLAAVGELGIGIGDSQDFEVLLALVQNSQHAQDPSLDDASREGRLVHDEDHVEGIAVSQQSLGHEAVVYGVGNRSRKSPVESNQPGPFVELVLVPGALGALNDALDDGDRFFPRNQPEDGSVGLHGEPGALVLQEVRESRGSHGQRLRIDGHPARESSGSGGVLLYPRLGQGWGADQAREEDHPQEQGQLGQHFITSWEASRLESVGVSLRQAPSISGLKPECQSSICTTSIHNVDSERISWHTPNVNCVQIKKRECQVNKQDLIKPLAADAELTHAQAAASIESFTTAIRKALKKGDDVTLVGFGSFKVAKRAARVGVNPQTKEKMKIPARKVVKFRPGSELKSAV